MAISRISYRLMASPCGPILVMMYAFLLEAGGLRQMARIHTAWHQRFLHDLGDILARYAFRLTRHDGDVLWFAQGDARNVDTPVVVDTMRALTAYVGAHMENLLDFTVILDYEQYGDVVSCNAGLERLLRTVRTPNSLYMTRTVVSALEPEVETIPEGPLFRVVAFCSDCRLSGPTYRDVLCNDTERERLRRLLAAGFEERGVWIQGRDRSVMTETVRAAGERDGAVPVTVRCRPGMTPLEFERALLQDLPDVSAYPSSGSEGFFEQALMVLRGLLKNPTATYLSVGMMEADLKLVAMHIFRRYLQSDSQRLLFVSDYDLCVGKMPDLLSWIPEAVTVGPLIVTATTDPPDEGWNVFRFEDDASVELFNTALRYWETSAGIDQSAELKDGLQRKLGKNHRIVLFIAALAESRIDTPVLDRLFPALGITLAERSRILGDLLEIGLVANLEPLRVHPGAEAPARRLVDGELRRFLEEEFAAFVFRETDSGTLCPTIQLWNDLERYQRTEQGRRYFRSLIHRLSTGGGSKMIDNLLAGGNTGAGTGGALRSARIRAYLRDSRGPEQCHEDARTLEKLIESGEGSVSCFLSLAEYYLAERDFARALKYCKQAMLLSQNETDCPAEPDGRGASQLLMGRISLLQHHARDVTQYLGFAREDARHDPVTLLIAGMLEACRLFLTGNLSRAGVEFDKLLLPLEEQGFTEWLLLDWFMKARISFELGQYERARDEFSLVTRYCEVTGPPEPVRVSVAWAARSELQENPTDRIARETLAGIGETPETLLFLGESCCLAGEFEQALPMLERSCAIEREQNRWPRLGVCWDNGFASAEDLIIADRPGTSELLRLGTAYQAWALAETGRMDDAVPLFFDLTRGNGGAGGTAGDPYTGLYNFLYSSILPRQRSPDRDDAVTVLGKAVKIIQERMGRLDDYRDKARFLQANVWNRRLMATARAYNLV